MFGKISEILLTYMVSMVYCMGMQFRQKGWKNDDPLDVYK